MKLSTPAGSFELVVAGDRGAPVALCLHGFPDTPQGFKPLLQGLAKRGFFAVAPYMRGYHPSPVLGPFHVDRLADDILALAEALSPARPVNVIGHDWGAIATYVALARSTGHFARAVTLAVPHPNVFLSNLPSCPRQLWLWGYVFFFNLGRFASKRAARNDFELVERLWQKWSPGFRPEPEYWAELKRCLAASSPAPFEYYQALLRPLGEALRRARRPLWIDTPTLHLHGADDGCIDARMTVRQERFFRSEFELRVLPKVGHFLHIERPDEICAQISAWLGKGPDRDQARAALSPPAALHGSKSEPTTRPE